LHIAPQTPPQLADALAALDAWGERIARIHADRSRLMAEAAAAAAAAAGGASDPARRAQHVAALDFNLQEGIWNFLITWLVVFCSIARPEQFAAYMLACAPWVPSMPCVQAGLRDLTADAAAAAAR
jgi:hypothetical protein